MFQVQLTDVLALALESYYKDVVALQKYSHDEKSCFQGSRVQEVRLNARKACLWPVRNVDIMLPGIHTC